MTPKSLLILAIIQLLFIKFTFCLINLNQCKMTDIPKRRKIQKKQFIYIYKISTMDIISIIFIFRYGCNKGTNFQYIMLKFMFKFFLFLHCIFIAYTASTSPLLLPLTLDLPELHNSTQPNTPYHIDLSPSQVYTHQSSLLTPIDNASPDICKSHPGKIITKKLAKLPTQATKTGNIQSSLNNQYLLSGKYSILYRIQAEKIIAYQIGDTTSSKKNISMNQIETYHLLTKQEPCRSVKGAISKDSQYLYVFGCHKVIKIQCKKILSDVQEVYTFESKNFNGTHLAQGDGLYIWASWTEGIMIFGTNFKNNLTLLQHIKPEEHLSLFIFNIAHIAYHDQMLYTLTSDGRIQIFSHLSPSSTRFDHSLSISLQKITKDAIFHNILPITKNNIAHSLYISATSHKKQEFIAQLAFSYINDELYLVRYYKNYDNLLHYSIFGDYLLLAANHILNIYETNKDPRSIRKIMNGISDNHFQPALGFHIIDQIQVQYIFPSPKSNGLLTSPQSSKSNSNIIDDKMSQNDQNFDQRKETQQQYQHQQLFRQKNYQLSLNHSPQIFCIIETSAQTTFKVLTLQKPYIECIYTEEQKEIGMVKPKYQLQIEQPCKNYENANQQIQKKVNFFYEHCTTKDVITIELFEDSISDHLLAITVVILFCAIVIGLMMLWRKQKIELIEKLVQEIQRVRSKNKMRVEFVEERNQISAKQSHWDDIRESYGTDQNIESQNGENDSNSKEENEQNNENRYLSQEKGEMKKMERESESQKQRSNSPSKKFQSKEGGKEWQEQIVDNEVQGTQRNMLT